MKPRLLITKVTHALECDAEGKLPQDWLLVDRLSQGLVSRYIWSRKTKSNEAVLNKETSNWILLQPFNPRQPLWLAVWNSENAMDFDSLSFRKDDFEEIQFEENAFTPKEITKLKSFSDSIQSYRS